MGIGVFFVGIGVCIGVCTCGFFDVFNQFLELFRLFLVVLRFFFFLSSLLQMNY